MMHSTRRCCFSFVVCAIEIVSVELIYIRRQKNKDLSWIQLLLHLYT